MVLDQLFKYLGYVKDIIELGILVAPFVSGFFSIINKKFHKQ